MPVSITDADATKQHVNECWRQHPRLNPAAFRESLGFTAGKLWLDLRAYVPRDDILLTAWHHGINAWLLSPRTLTSLHLPEPIRRDTLVLALESKTTDAPSQPVDILFHHSDNPDITSVIQLEQLARQNHITAYGITTHTALPLHEWLATAEAAAQKIHGRRKRPALRALMAPLNLTQTDVLHQPTSLHHDEHISPLEYAARLGWAVVATHATELQRADGQFIPLTEPTAPPPAALAALEAATHAEQQLHHTLGGWPTVNGQPLFSLLAILGQGETPFLSPAHGRAWATQVLPSTLLAWHKVGRPEATPYIVAYVDRLQRLAFHAAELGRAAAGAATARLLQALPGPASFSASPALSALNLVTSLPGIAGALVKPEDLPALLPAMAQPDHPDPAVYFPAWAGGLFCGLTPEL
jgi:hypothetical protein